VVYAEAVLHEPTTRPVPVCTRSGCESECAANAASGILESK
jgi:hypothetical protein